MVQCPTTTGDRAYLLTVRMIIVLSVAFVLSACSTGNDSGSEADGGSIFASLFSEDNLKARDPRKTSSGGPRQQSPGGGFVQFGGSGAVDLPPAVSTPQEGMYNLNFENAPIEDVVRAVLGDSLGITYTIASDVSGIATLSTARPLSREELLNALERVLRLNGAAMERRGETYSILSAGSAVASGTGGGGGPGFGMTILPLRYVAADAVAKLIDGFATRTGSVRVERSRNIVVLVGSKEDRQAAAETALSFDVDWLRDQSVGVFPLRRAKSEAVIPELERIFKTGDDAIGSGTVQFTRVARLNGILVVATNSELLSRARLWITRLDSKDAGLASNVHVYRVKYRNAQGLAELLNTIFVEGSQSPSPSDVEPETDDEALTNVSAFDSNLAERMGISPAAEEIPSPSDGPVIFGLSSPSPLRIRADTSNNSVVIYADADRQQEILEALHQLDVPQLQVAINVTMAEIRLNDTLRYGVQYFLNNGSNGGSVGLFNTLENAITRELPGFNFILGSERNPDVIIDAFDSITDVQVLSSPSLVVLDNEIAEFRVGDQIPVVTRTVSSVESANAPVSNEVTYRDTGVILKVKPRVSDNGVVNLVIEQEISAVTNGASSLTPTISNRLISSSISVVDRQTVLLGGLISEGADGNKSGIPGLHRMKGIGGLFGRKAKSNSRTEVIILIRPSVIRESQDAEHVARELRTKMWGLGSTQAR